MASSLFSNSSSDMVRRFAEFKKQMQGKDPEQIVRKMLAEGKMSQTQFEQLKRQAESLMTILR